ncbi:MAG: transglycosylase domain-containing protein [Bacilli bacterium]
MQHANEHKVVMKLKKYGIIAIGAVSLFLLSFLLYFTWIALGNYAIDDERLQLQSASTIVDTNGELITKLYVENREIVPIQQIPAHVQQAFVSVEDRRFYEHQGIDIRAILRALAADLWHGGKVQGGSTITQQLAKNIFLTNEKTIFRKVKEVLISLSLERKYSKDQILELYLNGIYFGHGAYGIQSAAQQFFGKDVSQLSIAEGAALAALPKAPATYSVVSQPEKNAQRRKIVLSLMAKEGYIDEATVQKESERTLVVSEGKKVDTTGLETYIDMVYEEAERVYHIPSGDLLRGGYKITVPLNRKLQTAASEQLNDSKNYPEQHSDVQSAAVFLDNGTGAVIAAVGGRDYTAKALNRVRVNRQPGSTIKPLYVYGPAMNEGLVDPYTTLPNERTDFDGYSPRNASDVYTKEATVYESILRSYNVPAVWTLDQLGVTQGKRYMQMMNISFPDEGLATALGGLEQGTSPLAIAAAYRTFWAEGVYAEPYIIESIERADGTAFATPQRDRTVVFHSQVAWDMMRMLQGVVDSGTAKSGAYDGALAGKTGTTNFPGKRDAVRDAWFAGITPEVTGTIWMGYDSNHGNEGIQSGTDTPVRLFKSIATAANLDRRTSFSKPDHLSDLEAPIAMPEITDLTLERSGFFGQSLQFTPSEDKRVIYRIYKERNGKRASIGEVIGVGKYDVPFPHNLTQGTYTVVPYDRITAREGNASNEAVDK